MVDAIDIKENAFIGVIFHDKVIFNVLMNDVDFLNTGLSIIHHLKRDRNKFIAKIIESQSYESIKYIFDDKIIFNELYDLNNQNTESFQDVMRLVQEQNNYDYFYMLDTNSNTLLIKVPTINEIFALDYTNSSDVREVINKINKTEEIQ